MRRACLLTRLLALPLIAVLAAGGWRAYTLREPSRPPELFGVVESVGPAYGGGTKFLVRSTEPNTPGWESSGNAWYRRHQPLCFVVIRDDTPVRRREGGPGRVAVGQTVSAWCSGPQATSMPPISGGDYVVIEPADR